MAVKSSPIVGITGSTGFIGSQLTELFKKNNISFIPFKGNLLKESDVEGYFKKNKISTVVHLVGGMSGSFEDLLKINVETTQNLLKIGTHYGLRKIIFASTGAIYKNNGKLAKENDMLEPTTLYGMSKVFTEEIIHFYERTYRICAIILRLPNVFGKGNSKNVIFKMMESIKREKKVYIAGDGKQRRQFLHVDDAAHAIFLSLKLTKSNTLNITNEKDNYSIRELSEILKKYFLFKTQKIPANNDLRNLLMSGEKSKKVLSFSPQNSLTSFLQSLI